MTDMILDAKILPEPLYNLVTTDKIRVRETGGIITLLPIMEGKTTDLISELRGSCADGKLTVEKFLEWRREGEELEA